MTDPSKQHSTSNATKLRPVPDAALSTVGDMLQKNVIATPPDGGGTTSLHAKTAKEVLNASLGVSRRAKRTPVSRWVRLIGWNHSRSRAGMLIVETIAKIRRAHLVQGQSIEAFAREFRVSRTVVRKVQRTGATEFRYEREVQPRPCWSMSTGPP
jgi:hypothetical protein